LHGKNGLYDADHACRTLALTFHNHLPTDFAIISANYKDMKGDANVKNGVVWAI